MNRQSMTSESHIASIDYRATIVVRSFICECDVALERYRTSNFLWLLIIFEVIINIIIIYTCP